MKNKIKIFISPGQSILRFGIFIAFSVAIAVFISPSLLGSRIIKGEELVRLENALLETKKGKKSVQLPYELKPDEFMAQGDMVRFKINLPLNEKPSASSPSSFFIERVSLSGRVVVNGEDIGSCGHGSLKNLRCLHQPLLLRIPASFLKKGDNSIDIDVYANSRQRNGLSTILFGSSDYLLKNIYSPIKFWRYDFVVATTWSTLLFGIIFLIIGSFRAADPLYFWFGLASILNALSSINLLSNDPWVNDWVTSWFIFSVRLSSAPITFLAVIEFFGLDPLNTKRFLISYALIAPIVVALSDNSRTIVILLYVPLLLIALALLISTAYWSYKSKKAHEVSATTMLYIVSFASIHDYIVMMGAASFTSFYLASHTLAVMLVVMSGLIIKIIVDAAHSSQQLSIALARKVALFEESLLEKHHQILDLESQNARIHERELLLREMHDGLGSNLALAKIRVSKSELSKEETTRIFDECIDDLRLILDSTEIEEDFIYALSKLRGRFNPRMKANGLKADWRINLKDLPPLLPQMRLNLMRIIQEALTNIFRHAHASNITVSLEYLQNIMMLDIIDNGIGFDLKDRKSHGQGLKNIERRTMLIGGEINIQSDSIGTHIKIMIPIT